MKAVKDETPEYVPRDVCIEILQTSLSTTRRNALKERNTIKHKALVNEAHFTESIIHHLKTEK